MPLSPALRAQLVQEAEHVLEELLAARVPAGQATLSDIEAAVRTAGERWMQTMTQALVTESAQAQRAEPLQCPRCQGRVQAKGQRSRQVVTETGAVTLRRNYYYCPACRAGFFPPG